MKPLGHKKWIYILFFASGISGLMYEVVWLRMLSLIMGVTLYATSTVLAAFMAGLALGSVLFGKYIEKRTDELKIYSFLELIIGLTALLVPVFLKMALPFYRMVYQASGGNLVLLSALRVLISFVVLLLPTTMMGGTLPVLTTWLVNRESQFGKNFGLLYGINTLGAVVGVLVSGFYTLGAFGQWATIIIGVIINLLVALTAYVLFTKKEKPLRVDKSIAQISRRPDVDISPYSDKIRQIVLITFALSGFTSLAYEVIWTRQLVIFLRTSIYAFSGMLAVYLTGISAGSIFMKRYVDTLKRPLITLGLLEGVVGVLSLINLKLFFPFDSPTAQLVFGLSGKFLATVVIVFPMTFVFGMIMPVGGVCFAKTTGKTGSSVGLLYSSNTIGSILGSLSAGFLMIPVLGSSNSVILLAYLNLALFAILILFEPQTRTARKLSYYLLIPLIILSTTDFNHGVDPLTLTTFRRIVNKGRNRNASKIYYHKEGLEGTVTAFEVNGEKQLWVNSVGMTHLCTETKLMAHLPLMYTEDPKEFLIICFGMGTTVKSAAVYNDLSVTAVELVPEAYDAFKYFHPDSQHLFSSGRIRCIVGDGRNFLLLTSKKFDVISVDPAPPVWSAGTVNLYSKEFFEQCKKRLNPGGTMCSWFPGGTESEVKSVLKTFQSVFPRTEVWQGPHMWGYYLIGTMTETDPDEFRKRVEKAFSDPDVIKDLVEYDKLCVTPQQLYRLRLWNSSEVRELGLDGHLITDDHPYLLFPLWRYLLKRRPFYRVKGRPADEFLRML